MFHSVNPLICPHNKGSGSAHCTLRYSELLQSHLYSFTSYILSKFLALCQSLFYNLLCKRGFRHKCFDLLPRVRERVHKTTTLQCLVLHEKRQIGAAEVGNLPAMSRTFHHFGGTVGT